MLAVIRCYCLILLLSGCTSVILPVSNGRNTLTGSRFFETTSAYTWKQRDSLAVDAILNGDIPSFLKKFSAVTITDSTGKHRLQIYVMPDYLSVGNEQDWARVPLTPMAATKIADSFQCILPTVKMVDAIYKAATVKLSPVPLFAFRDSSPTMYHHHLIIEGQRKGKKGLIAGIKKDVVQFNPALAAKRDRVAIYGWHKQDGKPIQPFYTGHVNWYVDYSHGIRLVYRKMKADGRWMDVDDVKKDSVFGSIIF